ncbi:MAG: uptake lipoprotein [Chlorobi bacterium]|nr:uptake lipoprotein [Chlorobiota bacterium]
MLTSVPARHLLLLFLGASLPFIAACGGSGSSVSNTITSEDRFKRGMTALADKDYEKAETEFNTIVLQDPASDYADDAQFYLAESYFGDENYKLAAFNYNRLRTSFPNSPFTKMALYRSGEAYYQSSLSYDRDQRESKYAIDVYNGFAQIYPSDSLTELAKGRVKELRGKLAKRDFMTADLYMKMEDYKAAVIYFDRVIELYPDTEYLQPATDGKARAQREMGQTDAMNASK